MNKHNGQAMYQEPVVGLEISKADARIVHLAAQRISPVRSWKLHIARQMLNGKAEKERGALCSNLTCQRIAVRIVNGDHLCDRCANAAEFAINDEAVSHDITGPVDVVMTQMSGRADLAYEMMQEMGCDES